jgi:hypothetical protein
VAGDEGVTLDGANELCAELNAVAPEGVSYEVAGDEQGSLLDEQPRVSPYYVRRRVKRGADE